MDLETTKNILAKPPSVFLNRNFLLLFYGKIISQLGDQIYAFALSWYILDLTKSSFQMAIFLVINTIAVAAISPLGGIIADRLNRKAIMVWMDVIRGLIVLLAALLLYQHLLQIWMLYMSALILGFCGAIFMPAASAIIPNIVMEDQLTEASSANQFTASFCTMIGMLVSGILYSWIGIFAIFIFNASSFLISGVMEVCVKIPLKKSRDLTKKTICPEINRALQELKEGFHYVKRNKVIFYLLLMNSMFNLIALPIGMVYIPYFFNVILKSTPLQLALPQAAIWTGMIVGSILVSLFLQRHKLKQLIFWGFSLLSFFTLIGIPWFIPQVRIYLNITNWKSSIFWTVTSMICGLLVSLFTIPMYVVFQKYISDEYRGRFWGLENSLRNLAMCSGFFIAGFLAQKIRLEFLFLGIAVVMFAINLWVVNIKEIKAFHD